MTIRVHNEPLVVRLAYLIGKLCTNDHNGGHFIVTGITEDHGNFIMYRAWDARKRVAFGRGWRTEYTDFITSHTRYREDTV